MLPGGPFQPLAAAASVLAAASELLPGQSGLRGGKVRRCIGAIKFVHVVTEKKEHY